MENVKVILDRKELSRKVIMDYSGKCRVKYFWNAHGKLSPFETDEHKNHTITGNLRIEEVETETNFVYSGAYKSTDWELWVDDKRLETDIIEYRINKTCMSIKVIVGWG